MAKTNIFVSSTCFDLQQVRRDLEDFIISLGHQPVMSDSPQIAIPPGISNVDVCKYLVNLSDIFVLIIGGRYGSKVKEVGKSITNIEYDTAFELEMPIYSFVDKEVWGKKDSFRSLKDLLDTGQLSDDKVRGILGPKIENVRVFEFIDRVTRAERDQWIFPFEQANEIKEILTNNLSLLFQDLLTKRRANKIGDTGISNRHIPKLSLMFQQIDQLNRKIGEPSDVLFVKPKTKLSKLEIIENLKTLKPHETDIRRIEDRFEDIRDLLNRRTAQQLGISKQPKDVAEYIKSVSSFSNHIDSLINLAEKDFALFENDNMLKNRSVIVNFIVHNDGSAPGNEVTIYIYPNEKVKYLKYDELTTQNIVIPVTLPREVSEVLDLSGNLDTLLHQPEVDVVNKIRKSLGFPNTLPANITPAPIFNTTELGNLIHNKNQPSISLENGNIRIDIHKLKHEFEIPILNKDIYICQFLENGEQSILEYECHADNLPKSTLGRIIIKTE